METKRLGYLDGIRGLAITAVIVFHWGAAYTPFGIGGFAGVTVFYVLSGYLITSILWRDRGRGYMKFLRGRVRRLYPALLGSLVFGLVLTLVIPNSGISFSNAAWSASLAVAQLTALWEVAHSATEHNLFLVTWSLSIEWYFYIAWGAVLFHLRHKRCDTHALARWALGVGATLWAVSLALPLPWAVYGPASNAAALLAGCGTAAMCLGRPSQPSWWHPSVVLCFESLLLTAWVAWVLFGTGYDYLFRVVIFPCTILMTVLLILSGRWAPDSFTRCLEFQPLVWIGRISYSLYLTHYIPLEVLTPHSFPVPKVALGVIGILLTVLATAITYIVLERPFIGRPRQPANSSSNQKTHWSPNMGAAHAYSGSTRAGESSES